MWLQERGWVRDVELHDIHIKCRYMPLGSMYGMFTYVYNKTKLNVGKYTIRGSYGIHIYIYMIYVYTAFTSENLTTPHPSLGRGDKCSENWMYLGELWIIDFCLMFALKDIEYDIANHQDTSSHSLTRWAVLRSL